MSRFLVGCVFVVSLGCGSAHGQSIDERIDAIFAPWDRADSGGAVVGVVKNGQLVFAKGYGMHDIAAGKRLTPESRMNLGSTSKQFAAAAIVLLAQDGALSLSDDIRKYLPEIPDYGEPITIQHLIHHTSGMRDYLVLRNLAGLGDDTAFGNGEVLELMSRQRELNFPPGTDHLYCNSGYVLLAIIVERVSGKTLTQFARERIFEPLGMAQTSWDTDLSLHAAERALSYPTRGAGIAPANRQDVVEGDGNVMSTVADLAKWDANFYEPNVGGTEFLEMMLERGKLDDGSAVDYASGLVHGTMFGRPIVEHGGAWLGFRAQLTRFPDDHLTIIVLGNIATMTPNALVEQVARVYLDLPDDAPAREAAVKLASRETVTISKRDLRAMSGSYFDDTTGALYSVLLRDDSLHIEMDGQSAELVAIDSNRFVLADGSQPVEFVIEEAASLTVERPDGSTTVAKRVDADVPAPRLDAFAGVYHSDEVGADFTIALRDGALHVTRPGFKESPLDHVYGDWFARGIRYRFERDAAGNVTGFRINLGRVRNIRFERSN